MKFFDTPAWAIVWAQWKAIFNRYPREGAGRIIITIGFSALWYLMVAAGAAALAYAIPKASDADFVRNVLGGGLLVAVLYWQVVPIILVSAGMSLELKKLLVYPVHPRELFGIEVLLRVTTGVEVLLLLMGTAVGLWRSPLAPWWGPFFFLPFAAMNLLFSAGLRDLLSRLLARKYVRELVVLGFVLLSVAPQALINLFPPEQWKKSQAKWEGLKQFWEFGIPWPWSVTASLVMGQGRWADWFWLAGWLLVGVYFGYGQFQRGLRFDADEQRAKERAPAREGGGAWKEVLYRLPSRLLPDPLGMLVEKEVRFLSRAPRFRLVFFMGFTFGLVVWLPLLMKGGARSTGFFGENLLSVVSLYACLILGEVLFWNTFGFDRTAAMAYYVVPVKMRTVLAGKNLTALTFLLLEISLVVGVCAVLGLRFPAGKVVECYAVTLLLALFLMGAGNLASVYFARPVNPVQNWRHSNSGKVQLYMLLLYPLMSLPIGLAYLARYAFDSEWGFYGVLGVAVLIGWIFYYVATDSAVEAAEARKETMLEALSRGEGPLA